MVQGLLLQLWAPLQFLGWFYRELRQSLVDMENFFTILQTKPSLPDGTLLLPDTPPAPSAILGSTNGSAQNGSSPEATSSNASEHAERAGHAAHAVQPDVGVSGRGLMLELKVRRAYAKVSQSRFGTWEGGLFALRTAPCRLSIGQGKMRRCNVTGITWTWTIPWLGWRPPINSEPSTWCDQQELFKP